MTEPRRERKVVTVLFADLVGFTSRAEQLDPEDVEEILRPYHERLRRELERHGGTVEKFIGDAVMAVFGAPVAHEDDAERAVRAGLSIREWATEDGNLEVRIAVNTGEALVRLGASPAHGEGMVAGDVVNTAARLQTAAPVNGVLVGEVTYRATRDAIEYREAEAVTAKGKAEPVQVWEAIEARSRVGLEAAAPATPLVGRQRELELLLGALARARDEASAQLVTLVGVPGIGKSRLVYELSQAIERQPDLISWRRGRSLPYGDGVTYWALSEMVKAQAGILETDAAEATETKLHAVISELADDAAEAQWLEASLRPLVGLIDEGAAHREDRFAAWRRFLEGLAERRPLVLVFEDLHWADDDLLDFVDYLVDWAAGVSLLVICIARPELLERRPAWGGGKPNALTISLSPLSDEETARLIGTLLERAVLPVETQTELLARAGGNPLFAEQFARMLAEREAGAALAIPETVHGMIAARLDVLARDEKVLLQDAAVIGAVFWAGALAVGERERSPVEQRLHGLERKEFVRRQRRPSVEGELEYAFHHLLVRDVAYSQIPRAARAEKHRAAAAWIESLGRPEDHAEMLAHHYQAALEYARAAGRETDELEARARVALREAGDRALGLNAFHPARRFYRAALELSPDDDPERPKLLFQAGQAEFLGAEAGSETLVEASDLLVRAGDLETAAEAEVMIAGTVWHGADNEAVSTHLRRAEELVRDVPPSRAKAYVLAERARFHMLASEMEDAVRVARQAIPMAEELGLDDLLANGLNNLGTSLVTLGDLGGLDDLRRSIELAERSGSPFEITRANVNLASILGQLGRVEAGLAYKEKASGVARRFGLTRVIHWLAGEKAVDDFLTGAWDDAVTAAESLIGLAESGTPHYMESICLQVRSVIRVARGDDQGAVEDAEAGLVRSSPDPQQLWEAIAVRAYVASELGDAREAESRSGELLELWRGPLGLLAGNWAVNLAVVLVALGRSADLLDAAARDPAPTRWLDGSKAYAVRDFARASEIFGEIPSRPHAALADLRAAEAAIAAGNRAEADFHLQRALAFWRSVGATRYVREGEALLAESA